MIKEIKQKLRKRYNTKQNQIESLKEELLKCYRSIDKKNELVIELYYIRDEKDKKIKELLDEIETLRKHKK